MDGGRCSDSPARQRRLHLGTCTFNPGTWNVGRQMGLAQVQFSFLTLVDLWDGTSLAHGDPTSLRDLLSTHQHPLGKVQTSIHRDREARGLPRRLLLETLHPGHSPPTSLHIRRSIIPGQIASETCWAQIRSSVRATFRGLKPRRRWQQVGSLAGVFFFRPFFFSILIFHLSTWLADDRLTRLPPRSIVVHARHGSGLLACRLTDG